MNEFDPFLACDTLADARFFIQRNIVDQLWNRLKAGQNVSIVGPMGSGKSSLLTFIEAEAPLRLGPTVQTHRLLVHPSTKRSEIQTDLATALGGRSNDLPRLVKNQYLLLLLDDLGVLDKGDRGWEVRNWLRGLSQSRTTARIQLVITSIQPLHLLFNSDESKSHIVSPLSGVMGKPIELGIFSPAETQQFIERALIGTSFGLTHFADFLHTSWVPSALREACSERWSELHKLPVDQGATPLSRSSAVSPDHFTLKLDIEQEKELYHLLLHAFPARDDLERLTYFHLETSLETISANSNDLAKTVFDLITWARSNGHYIGLIQACWNERPNNPALRAFAARIGVSLK